MDYWSVFSKNPVTQVIDRPDDPPYLNYFDTTNGIIIADANYQSEDKRRQLNWSELMYQTWALANQTREVGGPISNLRSIVQSHVVNDRARDVFNIAYDRNLLRPSGDGPEDWHEWNESSHPSFFLSFLATDNVKGAVWLLHDHAAEMGRKEISKIFSLWDRSGLHLWYAEPHCPSKLKSNIIADFDYGVGST
ncbi:MAG: hypothetical protein Q9221_002744 [Calogaya cf. arnoldii]